MILKNENIEIKIILNTFYLKFYDLNGISEYNLNKILFYYKIFHIISFNNKIKFPMILDLSDININIFSIYNNINVFTKLLNKIQPISNFTVDYTIVILSELSKTFINLILNLYKPSKPFYLVSNKNDILNL